MANSEKFREEVQLLFDGVKDISPDKLLLTYNGVMYPSAVCNTETFQAIESIEAREDDILLVTYPKSGTNWAIFLMYDMIHSVYNQDPPAMMPMIEFKGQDKIEKLKQAPSPRVLSTHLNYDLIPKSFFQKKTKMLVVFRNPKDTAVSLFHFYNSNPGLPTYSSWDTYFQDYISGNVVWGSYFDHAVAWNKHINDEGVFIITFEDMKKDLDATVKNISDFFGFSLTKNQIQHIAEKGTFESMKERSKETHGEYGQIIFRKGVVGEWKMYFSEAQSQEIDAKYEEYLSGTKLGEMMNYNVYCKL
ncbi:sulfotransferase 6B1-like [Discoglossus pictus]